MSSNTHSVSLRLLKEQIKIARHRMEQLWNEKGGADAQVLTASIEVDRLINEYHRACRDWPFKAETEKRPKNSATNPIGKRLEAQGRSGAGKPRALAGLVPSLYRLNLDRGMSRRYLSPSQPAISCNI